MLTQASDSFAYDAVGNLTRADNSAARIRRGYDLAGRLVADTLWVAQFDTTTQAPNGFISPRHLYVYRYGYDLDGRVLWQRPSDNLAPSATYDSIGYAYDSAGFLDTATDPNGNSYTFTYDAQGRPTGLVRTLTGGGTVSDTMAYDTRSRLTYHEVVSSTDGVILSESPTYDLLGRMTGDGSDTFSYDPLGALSSIGSGGFREEYSADPLGRRVGRDLPLPTSSYSYTAGTGVLSASIAGTSPKHPNPDTTLYTYINAGLEQQSTSSGASTITQTYDYDWSSPDLVDTPTLIERRCPHGTDEEDVPEGV